jgi:hypothetical protein
MNRNLTVRGTRSSRNFASAHRGTCSQWITNRHPASLDTVMGAGSASGVG